MTYFISGGAKNGKSTLAEERLRIHHPWQYI